MSSDFGHVDEIVSAYAARGGQPGIAYGIVAGGDLVHCGGVGARRLDGPAPDAETVFRIASMTKSFTAWAILLLRDSGALALDDPAEMYVPELAGWPLVSPDAGRVTIRHLLTMTAGFPTDDPWGDRQQGLPLDDFARLLAGGVRFNWAPGTRFEYSNLGYAILGRIVTAAGGDEYAGFVRAKVLEPLGMTRTGYTDGEFAGDGLAQGYRRGLAGWEEVPFDPHGAFAPMGGVFSCVRDLATWVSGFASAFPPGASLAGGHPLAAASRREMQLPQVVIPPGRGHSLPGGPAGGPGGYGFGLFVDEHPTLGRVVSHSGGYPGFGSNMRWHPASGTGVIALGNGTYAPMSLLATMLLEAVVPRRGGYQVALAPVAPRTAASGTRAGGPWPETLAAREAVTALLTSWDDAVADSLFTENVALDRPYPERVRDIALLRERIGAFTDSGRPPEHDTPAHCRWFLAGEQSLAGEQRQVVQAQIQLSPEVPPRVQSLTLAIPPAAGSPLATTLAAVIAWLNSGSSSWQESIAVAPGTDVSLLTRRLRMAAAWTGVVSPRTYRAGDGASSVSVDLSGQHAPAILALLVDSATGALRAAEVTL